MLRNREKRGIPGLNTSATADISFMMLIFFLVTTSMDADKAMKRQMPPAKPEQEMEQREVNSNLVMTLVLKADGSLVVDDNPSAVADLRKPLKEFILKVGKQHIIQIETHPECDYDSYFQLQNEILRAYREIKESAAKQKYGHSYKLCNDDQRKVLNDLYPQRIQEVVVK